MRSRNPSEAAVEHRPGVPRDAYTSILKNLERDDRRIDEVPQFMDKEAHPLTATVRRVDA